MIAGGALGVLVRTALRASLFFFETLFFAALFGAAFLAFLTGPRPLFLGAIRLREAFLEVTVFFFFLDFPFAAIGEVYHPNLASAAARILSTSPHAVQRAAKPCTWNRKDDQRDWIPQAPCLARITIARSLLDPARRQQLLQPVVACRDALLHRRLQDTISRLARSVEHGLCHCGLSGFFD